MLELESSVPASCWRRLRATGAHVLPNTGRSLQHRRGHSEQTSGTARGVTWKLDTCDASLYVVSKECGRDLRQTQGLANKMITLLARCWLSELGSDCSPCVQCLWAEYPFLIPSYSGSWQQSAFRSCRKMGCILALTQDSLQLLQLSFVEVQGMWVLYSLKC